LSENFSFESNQAHEEIKAHGIEGRAVFPALFR